MRALVGHTCTCVGFSTRTHTHFLSLTPPTMPQVSFQREDGSALHLGPAQGGLFPFTTSEEDAASVAEMVAAAAELVEAKTGERVEDVVPGKRESFGRTPSSPKALRTDEGFGEKEECVIAWVFPSSSSPWARTTALSPFPLLTQHTHTRANETTNRGDVRPEAPVLQAQQGAYRQAGPGRRRGRHDGGRVEDGEQRRADF